MYLVSSRGLTRVTAMNLAKPPAVRETQPGASVLAAVVFSNWKNIFLLSLIFTLSCSYMVK